MGIVGQPWRDALDSGFQIISTQTYGEWRTTLIVVNLDPDNLEAEPRPSRRRPKTFVKRKWRRPQEPRREPPVYLLLPLFLTEGKTLGGAAFSATD